MPALQAGRLSRRDQDAVSAKLECAMHYAAKQRQSIDWRRLVAGRSCHRSDVRAGGPFPFYCVNPSSRPTSSLGQHAKPFRPHFQQSSPNQLVTTGLRVYAILADVVPR
jgi:hypothetical protein